MLRVEKSASGLAKWTKGYLDVAWAWTSTRNIVAAIASNGSVLADTGAISCGTFCRRRGFDTTLRYGQHTPGEE